MPRRARPIYLDLIERDREDASGAASERSRRAPLAVRSDDPRAPELRRELGKHYERCKAGPASKRFRGDRLKNYCAATAWTIVERSGRFPELPNAAQPKVKSMKRRTPPRDPRTGLFLKRGSTRRRPKSGTESRQSTRRRAPHNVRGYTMQRAGKTVRVRPHRSRETRAAAPAAPRRRRASARRRSSGTRRSSPRSTNIAIVPVGAREMMSSPRRRRARRRMSAKAPPMATAGGLVIAGLGGLIGYEVSDLVDRYMAGYSPSASPAPTLPSGVADVATYNDLAVAAKPSMGRIFAGLGNAVMGFVVGAFAPWAGLKMFAYGWGLGATFHVGGKLLNVYVVQPLFAKTDAGARMFTHEQNAQAKLNPPATTSTTQGLGAPPSMVSRRGTPVAAAAPVARALPGVQPTARIPVSLARQRAAVGLGAVDQTVSLPGSDAPPPPPMQQTQPPAPPPAPPAPPPSTTVCAPCATNNGPPQMAPVPTGCSGRPTCGCGNCGAPPDEDPVHPIFRAMARGTHQRQTRWGSRNAA